MPHRSALAAVTLASVLCACAGRHDTDVLATSSPPLGDASAATSAAPAASTSPVVVAPSASASQPPSGEDPREITATLVDLGAPVPACGMLKAWGTFTYQVGPSKEQPGSRAVVRVLVPCPDMSRAKYGPAAGDVVAFHVGDRHHLFVHRITARERKETGVATPDPVFVADRIDRAP